ncbi:glycosyltransferase family 4 protein [Prosthecomicrobium sp. N25]|uniref:glycosyltransferase family 4 protein n=1 Tax=Prosthecomicrobium sp. N25 TaxID=3129254 RepID=UPI0030789BF3
MDLVYVYGLELPNTAANSGAVLGLCDALADLGHRVTLAHAGEAAAEADIRRDYDLDPAVRLRTVRIRAGFRHYPGMALEALREAPGAVLITRMPIVAAVAAMAGRPAILEMHQRFETARRWPFWRWGLVTVPRRRLAVAALTPALVEDARRDPFARRFPMEVIPSGAPDYGGPQARPQPDVDVGYLGSFKPGKGIELVAALAAARPSVRFVVFGDPSANPDAAAELAALGNVELAGHVPRAGVAAALARFRIGLAPYGRAGFGGAPGTPFVSSDSLSSLKLVEYMSSGRAIISSAIPSVAAMVEDGASALLCDPERLPDWLAALDRLLADPGLVDRMAAAGRARFLADYTFRIRAERFATLAASLRP